MKINLPSINVKALTYEEIKKENPFSTHESFITEKQINDFEKLLSKDVNEKVMDSFLSKNSEIFTSVLHDRRTGNHIAIVIPKQILKSKISYLNEKGLIPDYIIGGKNSDGWEYWVVELKGPTQNLFSSTHSEIYFSPEINKGICQLLQYVDYCSEFQSHIRDCFKLQDFREPKGILIASREKEFSLSVSKQKLKAAFNKATHGSIEIRTYDLILRHLRPLFNNYHLKK